MANPPRAPAIGAGSSIYNFFYHLGNDIRLACTDFDQKAQMARFGKDRPVTPDDLQDKHVRIFSIALRAYGCLGILMAGLIVNPILGRYGLSDLPFTIFRLAAGGIIAVIAHDCLVVGSKIMDLMDQINRRPERNPTSVVSQIRNSIYSFGKSIYHEVKQIGKAKPDLINPESLRNLVKGTWIVQELYYQKEADIIKSLNDEARQALNAKLQELIQALLPQQQ